MRRHTWNIKTAERLTKDYIDTMSYDDWLPDPSQARTDSAYNTAHEVSKIKNPNLLQRTYNSETKGKLGKYTQYAGILPALAAADPRSNLGLKTRLGLGAGAAGLFALGSKLKNSTPDTAYDKATGDYSSVSLHNKAMLEFARQDDEALRNASKNDAYSNYFDDYINTRTSVAHKLYNKAKNDPRYNGSHRDTNLYALQQDAENYMEDTGMHKDIIRKHYGDSFVTPKAYDTSMFKTSALKRSDFDYGYDGEDLNWDTMGALTRRDNQHETAMQAATIDNPNMLQRNPNRTRLAAGAATLSGLGLLGAAHHYLGTNRTTTGKLLGAAGMAGGLGLLGGGLYAGMKSLNLRKNGDSVYSSRDYNRARDYMNAQDDDFADSLLDHPNYTNYEVEARKAMNDDAYNAYMKQQRTGAGRLYPDDLDSASDYYGDVDNTALLHKHFGKDTFNKPYDMSGFKKTSAMTREEFDKVMDSPNYKDYTYSPEDALRYGFDRGALDAADEHSTIKHPTLKQKIMSLNPKGMVSAGLTAAGIGAAGAGLVKGLRTSDKHPNYGKRMLTSAALLGGGYALLKGSDKLTNLIPDSNLSRNFKGNIYDRNLHGTMFSNFRDQDEALASELQGNKKAFKNFSADVHKLHRDSLYDAYKDGYIDEFDDKENPLSHHDLDNWVDGDADAFDDNGTYKNLARKHFGDEPFNRPYDLSFLKNK